MRILWGVAALITAALAGACARGGDELPAQAASVEEIAAASPDAAMKERWRDAAAKGQLPPLESLPGGRRGVVVRTPAQVADAPRTPAAPVIQDTVVATVQPFSRVPLEEYTGAFTVTNATPGVITGTVTGRPEPFELHFKLPDAVRLVPLDLKSPHRLLVRDAVVNQSLRRELFLSTADRAPMLVFISDGAMRPYARRFEEIPLDVRQLPPGADAVSRVTVTLGGAAATLRPGDRARLTVGGMPLEVFLETSYWTPPDRIETVEGDAYHVTLMLYRPTPG